MKPSAHYPSPDWFRPSRTSYPARMDVNVRPQLMRTHPLAALWLTLAGSILAGTAWTAAVLWWINR